MLRSTIGAYGGPALRHLALFCSCGLLAACATSGPPPAPTTAKKPTARARPRTLPKGVGPRRGRGAIKPEGHDELAAAKKLARDGDAQGALAAARKAQKINPAVEEAYLLIGSLCSITDDIPCAKDIYAEGIRVLPQASGLRHANGMLLLEDGDLPGAIDNLEQANSLGEGRHPDVLADLAYAYVFAKRLDEAFALASAARRMAPKSYAAAYTLGEVHLKRGQAKDAVAAFRAASTIAPGNTAALRRLAHALTKLSKDAEALTIYDALAKRGGKDPRVHAARAGLLLKKGDNDAALAAMTTAVALAPDNIQLLRLLLHTQKKAEDDKGARQTADRISDLEGRIP